MTTASKTPKAVRATRTAPPMHWVGDGFPVRSMFSYHDAAAEMSPFLLLDYAAPTAIAPSPTRRGVGEHPHRGFETVTIVYQGEIEHRDSAGNRGTIGPGDVQWMTAASGVVHEEMHSRAFAEKGGTMQMVQLWVNLPASAKMSKPRYQDLVSRSIPSVALAASAGHVRVIAGEFHGVKGPARTVTPLGLWDVRVNSGGGASIDLPEGHTAAILVLHGRVVVNGARVGESELAVFDRRGESVAIAAEDDATLLVLSGAPIDEPVVGYGPFVMNTELEIAQAIADYQDGAMGRLST